MKTFGIIVLPGSNCDSDCFYAVRDYLNQDAQYVWHEERNLDKYDVLMIQVVFPTVITYDLALWRVFHQLWMP